MALGSAERAAVDDVAAAAAGELITTVGIDLYGELRAQVDGNLAVSPYSVVSALAMTRVPPPIEFNDAHPYTDGFES